MVVFLEKRIVLHSSLLKLHVDATAIYRDHLLDSAETKSEGRAGYYPSTLFLTLFYYYFQNMDCFSNTLQLKKMRYKCFMYYDAMSCYFLLPIINTQIYFEPTENPFKLSQRKCCTELHMQPS